jgi:hypothetical protein
VRMDADVDVDVDVQQQVVHAEIIADGRMDRCPASLRFLACPLGRRAYP